ncbi:MAG: type II toxin-antitoxin system RelE/ParE family toxin [Propionibacteriaceae bacterium]|nr:type II toxin-antitoxin system RelE/ParE family toxin [Propionibacteriaceae bacterium]
MTWRARLGAEAEADIDEALDWYADKAPDQCARFWSRGRADIDRIEANPHQFPSDGGYRRLAMEVFPYNIWFWINDVDELVHIVGVIHFRRGPEVAASRRDR